jgi:hypothetical protein
MDQEFVDPGGVSQKLSQRHGASENHVGAEGFELGGEADELDGIAEAVAGGQNKQAAADERLSIPERARGRRIGETRAGAVIIITSGFKVTEREMSDSAISKGGGVRGVDGKRNVKTGERIPVAAHHDVQVGQIVQGRDEGGIDSKRLCERAVGVSESSEVGQGEPLVIVHASIKGSESKCAIEKCERLGGTPGVDQSVRKCRDQREVVGPAGQSVVQANDGAGVITPA